MSNDDEFAFFYADSQNEDYMLAKYLQEVEETESMLIEDECERDHEFARELQKYLNEVEKSGIIKNDIFVVNGKRYTSLVDPRLDTLDPTPDIWHLFRDYDQHFFNSMLVKNSVQLEWSKRMTSCAGVCQWDRGFCSIRLSSPLLTLRKRSDLIETLLHEMIHAYLFIMRERDSNESHGPKFHEHMYRINKEAKTNITVYHNFHDEVAHYQNHVWRCDGPCNKRGPYYGFVRRSTNRQPSRHDYWWTRHEMTCGGTFHKISEPKKELEKKKLTKSKTPKLHTLSGLNFTESKDNTTDNITVPKKAKKSDNLFVPFSGRGFVLGTSKKSAKSTRSNVSLVDNNDDLESSFYQNSADDEFIKTIDIDNLLNERKSVSTPSVLKYFPVVSKKKEIEVLQID